MTAIMKKIGKYYRRLDKLLLISVTICSLLSVVLLYSLYVTKTGELEARYYVIQLVSTILGIGVCLIVTAMDYHHFSRLWFIYVPISIAAVALTFTSLGLQRAGADDRAWLDLGT